MFSKSDSFKSEYCCSIIRVGEVKPIEGKDKIGYTLVNGETIVVRKDQVKEGSKIVCILTGNGLKDPDNAIKFANSDIKKTSADMTEILRAMNV